jgi:hypothetical protein
VLVELHTEKMNNEPANPQTFTVRRFELEDTISHFELNFDFQQVGNEIIASVIYNTDLFDRREIELMKERFIHLLIDVPDEFKKNGKIRDVGFRIKEEENLMAINYLKFDMEERF